MGLPFASLFTGKMGKYGRLRKEMNRVSREAMSLIPDACLYELADYLYGIAECRAMVDDDYVINAYHKTARFQADAIACLVLKDREFLRDMGDIYDSTNVMVQILSKYNLGPDDDVILLTDEVKI